MKRVLFLVAAWFMLGGASSVEYGLCAPGNSIYHRPSTTYTHQLSNKE